MLCGANNHKTINDLVFISLFSFQLVTYIPLPLNLSTIIYIGFIIVLGICNIRACNLKFKVHRLDNLFAAVFFILLARLIYDLLIVQTYHNIFVNRITYFVYFISLTIFPFVLIRSLGAYKDLIKRNISVLLILHTTALLLSLYYNINHMLAGVSLGFRFSANINLDTIGYGYLSLTQISLSLTYYWLSNKRLLNCLYVFILLLLGTVSLIMANSRSPIGALIVIVIFLLFYFKKKVIIILSISVVIISLPFIYRIDKILTDEYRIYTLNRILNAVEGDSSNRDILFKDGVKMIEENPLFGKSFVLQDPHSIGYGGYVHNFFLEAFMSAGFLGGILFLLINVCVLYASFYISYKDKSYLLFTMYFLQHFVLSFISRSMYNMPSYWISIAFVYSAYLYERYLHSSKLIIRENERCFTDI